jgi:hypothetical protein
MIRAALFLAQSNGAPDNEIDDIRPPYFFHDSPFAAHPGWLVLALVLLAFLVGFVVFLLLSPQATVDPKSAYDLALEKLAAAQPLLREDDPMPYAITVSKVVRDYVRQRFAAPSTRRTTEEFLRLMERDPAAPLAAHRELLRDFLRACDLVKFARYQPRREELELVQKRACDFVLATKPAPERRA